MPDARPSVLVLNGPNLNLLGTREPEIYGYETLADVEEMCREVGEAASLEVEARQSNHEGELVGWIQEARGRRAAIVINPAAYSHTSVAILDALKAFEGTVIELHLSNIHARESFRHHSYVSVRADGIVCGFGTRGYRMAIEAVAAILNDQTEGA